MRRDAINLFKAAVMFIMFCLLVFLSGCFTLEVKSGEQKRLGRYDHHAVIHSGGTLLVPVDEQAEEEQLEEMQVWQCHDCGEWWPKEFNNCESCR